jgi:hypothetical protein
VYLQFKGSSYVDASFIKGLMGVLWLMLLMSFYWLIASVPAMILSLFIFIVLKELRIKPRMSRLLFLFLVLISMAITFHLMVYEQEQVPFGKWGLYLYISLTVIAGGLIADIRERIPKGGTIIKSYGH